MFYTAILPLILQTILMLLPSLWGMRQALQPQSLLLRTILWAVAVVTALAVPSWFWWPGSWQMRLLSCYILASWPSGCSRNRSALAPRGWHDLESAFRAGVFAHSSLQHAAILN